MMIKKSLPTLMLLSATLALSGCWEPEGVVLHEPGEYKGPEDNLEVDTAALQERLAGQMDR